jgi:DNA-binding transcriptional LysR family regulator
MVEAGLGISIVPLLSSGNVTRGRRVGIRPLDKQIRPIRSGILVRKSEHLSESAKSFVEFVRDEATDDAR